MGAQSGKESESSQQSDEREAGADAGGAPRSGPPTAPEFPGDEWRDWLSNELALHIFDTAPVGRCVIDTALRYVRINKRLAAINGEPAEAHVGRTVREMIPYLADIVETHYRQVLETGQPMRNVRYSGATPTQPGVKRSFLEHYYPLADKHGAIFGINVVVEEVTEQRQMEEALQRSEQRFRLIAENATDLIAIVDARGWPKYMSPSTEQIVGYPVEQLLATNAFTLIHPEDVRDVSQVGLGKPFEVRVRNAGGNWIWIEANTDRVIWEGEEHVVLIARDTTWRKRAEAELRALNESLETRVRERTRSLEQTARELEQSLALFFTLFHSIPVPTSITRLSDGTHLDVNEEFLRYLGLEKEEVIGRPSEALALWAHAAARERFVAQLEQYGRVENMLIQMRHPARGVRQGLISGVRVSYDGEDAILATFVDITDRIQAEQQIRALAMHLAQAEERERKWLAQELHDAGGQLLSALQIHLHILQAEVAALSADLGQQVAEGASLAARAQEEIRAISHAMRPLVLDQLGLKPALEQLCQETSGQARMEMRCEIGDLGQVPDYVATQCYRVLQEALNNVVRHAQAEHARLVVERDESGLTLAVADDGVGFDVERESALRQGLGLRGLRERLEVLGGSLTIESRPGGGTQLTGRIPLSGS